MFTQTLCHRGNDMQAYVIYWHYTSVTKKCSLIHLSHRFINLLEQTLKLQIGSTCFTWLIPVYVTYRLGKELWDFLRNF